MITRYQLLERPWGRYTNQILDLKGGELALNGETSPYLQVLGKSDHAPTLKQDGSLQILVKDVGDHRSKPWCLYALSRSVDPSKGFYVEDGTQATRIFWRNVPKRPEEKQKLETEEDQRAAQIMSSVHAVRSRIQAVEIAQEDPIALWDRVVKLWEDEAKDVAAEMDILAKHAKTLKNVLRELELSPRKILSRNRSLTPLSRVQEMDRAGMLWLSRQPGNNWPERAGPSQRILAPTRYESSNTLENRVLLSLAELTHNKARQYIKRNHRACHSTRYRTIERHGNNCRRLARALANLGVARAAPDVAPNYVLQNDARYNRIWTAYQELLKQKKELDDLWRWQARSWEEFCTLAVAVACRSVRGAKVIAAAPIDFREEHSSGIWLNHDNPLVTLYLKEQDLIVEVLVRQDKTRKMQKDLGAPCIIKCSGFSEDFSRLIPVWPLHSFDEIDPSIDVTDLNELFNSPGFRAASSLNIKGAIVLRNTFNEETVKGGEHSVGHIKALASTIGPRGPALILGLEYISSYITQIFEDLSR